MSSRRKTAAHAVATDNAPGVRKVAPTKVADITTNA